MKNTFTIDQDTIDSALAVIEAHLEAEKAREEGRTVIFQPPESLTYDALQAYKGLLKAQGIPVDRKYLPKGES